MKYKPVITEYEIEYYNFTRNFILRHQPYQSGPRFGQWLAQHKEAALELATRP